MAESVLPCFVCGKTLTHAFGGLVETELRQQPNDAVIFSSHGNYGSTLFDELGEEFLELNICDECLYARSDRILHCRHRTTRHRESMPWTPDPWGEEVEQRETGDLPAGS